MLSYQSVLHFYYRLDLGQDAVIVASSLNENGNEKKSIVYLGVCGWNGMWSGDVLQRYYKFL